MFTNRLGLLHLFDTPHHLKQQITYYLRLIGYLGYLTGCH